MRAQVLVGICSAMLVLATTLMGHAQQSAKKLQPGPVLDSLTTSLTAIKQTPLAPRMKIIYGSAPKRPGQKCNASANSCFINLMNYKSCDPVYNKCMALPATEGPIADYDSKPASFSALCADDPKSCGAKLAKLQDEYCGKKVYQCIVDYCGVPC